VEKVRRLVPGTNLPYCDSISPYDGKGSRNWNHKSMRKTAFRTLGMQFSFSGVEKVLELQARTISSRLDENVILNGIVVLFSQKNHIQVPGIHLKKIDTKNTKD
jgi:hypothetical protein